VISFILVTHFEFCINNRQAIKKKSSGASCSSEKCPVGMKIQQHSVGNRNQTVVMITSAGLCLAESNRVDEGLDKAPGNLVWSQSWPCIEPEVGLETSWGPFQPELSYSLVDVGGLMLGNYDHPNPLTQASGRSRFPKCGQLKKQTVFTCEHRTCMQGHLFYLHLVIAVHGVRQMH